METAEVTALIGPNGAGKSTLLHILLGLEPASSGTATFDGKRYNELGPSPFNVVGSFIDGLTPNPSRTGLNHLRWVALGAGVSFNRCDECLRLVGLCEACNRMFKTYSLGMKQRLGIATAILTDAPYLILDEPLNGLDPEGIKWVRDFIKDYVSGHRTVVVSSHYMAELELVADHVVGLSNGRKVLDGDIDALLDKYGSLEQAYFNVVKR
ncbi:ABC transporter ATP-binding protein [Bifidobacterium scardovii]|uniref:Abc transporter related protein n=1 Tax=Bifidobacterium scardovii TaxID=158787 RepID=A0A087DAL0_9BIFI|nr:ATP-binding cassette domain-containing protein [Bifidobacterium scardovii]KFI92560.1 abc transporter related protein [Bifidobacterium scardovii]MBS6946817.1 ATP-binding cassette domain-containing protein [Bifidobacterium scardovii]MDK6349030.1 ATP-binding cassette domain-containing protein [Bifidobacterium scardovii]MDU3735521.1 ATP-binding cassette domain-containing protein [Bifidobacterium scardovii]MDU5297373.1 ATP-binding cassette domain-containing protein [Bifidobacterium scardovii]